MQGMDKSVQKPNPYITTHAHNEGCCYRPYQLPYINTRMHSSRMRTVHLLPISPSMHSSLGHTLSQGVYLVLGGCTWSWGVYLVLRVYLVPGGYLVLGVYLVPEGTWSQGVYLVLGVPVQALPM